MGYPPIEELLPKTNFSIYKLVRLACCRAIELAEGKKKIIDIPSAEKATTVALEEIRAGRVVIKETAEKFRPEKIETKKADVEEAVA